MKKGLWPDLNPRFLDGRSYAFRQEIPCQDMSDPIRQIHSQCKEKNVNLSEKHRPKQAPWGVVNSDPVVY